MRRISPLISAGEISPTLLGGLEHHVLRETPCSLQGDAPARSPPDRVLLCPSVSGAAASLLPPRLLAGLQAMAVPLMHLQQDSARGLTHSQGVVAPGGCA